MKKRKLIKYVLGTLLIILLILSIVIPLYSPNLEKVIIASTSLISAVASTLTFLLALLLFNKYGIESKFVDKQAESILELLALLKEQNLLILGENRITQLFLGMINTIDYEDAGKTNLVFSISYFSDLENIWKKGNSLYIPKSIRNALKCVTVSHLTQDELYLDKSKYSRVTIPSHKKWNTNSDDYEDNSNGESYAKWGLLNGKEITLLEFQRNWGNVITMCTKWLENNSSISIDINLDSA